MQAGRHSCQPDEQVRHAYTFDSGHPTHHHSWTGLSNDGAEAVTTQIGGDPIDNRIVQASIPCGVSVIHTIATGTGPVTTRWSVL